jgi:transposase
MPTKVSTIEIDMTELDDILRRVDANELTEGDCEAIRTLCKAYVQLTELLKDKNTSLTRLRKLLFGSTTEKTKTVLGNDQDSPSPSARAVTASTSDVEIVEKTPAKGHGRNGADAYAGAQKVVVRHNTLQPGDPCPKCEAGTVYETGRPGLRDRPARFTRQAGPVYETGRPGVLVRLVGQSPIQAKIYELQKLRCNLCSEVFTAQAPEEIGTEKYDATAGSMVALLKYGTSWVVYLGHRFDSRRPQDRLVFQRATTRWREPQGRVVASSANVEACDLTSQKRLVLQDGSWRARRRRFYEPDPYVRVVRGERFRLSDRA